MRRIYRVNHKEFEYLASSGYKIGDETEEMLQWIKENVHSYQMYAIDGTYSNNGCYILVEILVYEED